LTKEKLKRHNYRTPSPYKTIPINNKHNIHQATEYHFTAGGKEKEEVKKSWGCRKSREGRAGNPGCDPGHLRARTIYCVVRV
jgi:hypothetical protein